MQRNQRGQALISAIVGVSVVVLLLLSLISWTEFSGKLVGRQLTYQGQAHNAAVAGLTDALSWFRRQPTQPVPTFNPTVNATSTPPVDDTEDSSIGIVRDFSVSDSLKLMGRYEVTKGTLATGKGTYDSTTQIPGKQANLVTGAAASAAGTVWQIESTGYIWVQNSTSAAWNVAPNKILVKQTVRSVIQTLTVNPPASSAIFSRRGSLITTTTNSKIQGGANNAAVYPSSTGTPVGPSGTMTGTPPQSTVGATTGYDIGAVFGVTKQELLGLADYNVSQVSDLSYTDQGLGKTLPTMSLITISGNAVFDATHPLTGSGVLVVFGDITVNANTNSSYSGVIYCTGNVVINPPSLISGTIIGAGLGSANGAVTINSSGGNVTEVDYDQNIITQVQQQLGQYRFSRNPYVV